MLPLDGEDVPGQRDAVTVRQGGIRSAFSSPDLLARVEGGRVPIEAKRPRKVTSVDGAIRKGVSQVEGGETRGVIALSLDLIVRPEHTFLHGSSGNFLEREVASRLQGFVSEHTERISHRVSDRDVMGLFLMVRYPAWGQAPSHRWIISCTEVQVLHHSKQEFDLMRALFEALETASQEGPYSAS